MKENVVLSLLITLVEASMCSFFAVYLKGRTTVCVIVEVVVVVVMVVTEDLGSNRREGKLTFFL